MKYLILFLTLVPAWGQVETYGHKANAATTVDMSAALSSRPVPEKSSDPATCTEGQRYYNTTSHKGRLCTGTNTWADEAGSGSAATLSTPRAIYGNNFDGSAALTQIIASTYGGTGNGFTKFSGPATAEKTFTLPNASATILTSNAAVTVAQGGTGATTLTGPLKGNGTSAFSAAGYADIVGLWTTCTGFLKNDGTCAAAGSGTVTVVSSGSLTSTALVTGGGTTTLQTPSATATLDSSGNISTPGAITTGAGGSTAGVLELGQGTAPSAGTTSVKLYAPASVTSYVMNLPGAAATGYLYGTNSSGVVTQSFRTIQAGDVPALGDRSETLTNKTLDAEGTGNSITIPVKIWLPAVGCAGTTGTLMWDTLASNAPTATCSAGTTETTMMRGTADFPDSDGSYSLQQPILLPDDWTGAIDVKFLYRTTATSGNTIWQAATSCRADAEVDDAAFNTASVTSADAAKGTTNQLNTASIAGVTATGCAAGELLHLKIIRDRTHASDTMTGIVSLVGVEVTLRRAM